MQDRFSIPAPGAVKPLGWLRDWARGAAQGCTGHMSDVDEEFVRAWKEDFQPRGQKLNWWEGTWSFEGGAYWFDGLVRLAFQLDDQALKTLARQRLEPVLANMNSHSIGFCWWLDRNNPQDIEDVQKADWMVNWVAGMFARPLSAWYAATGDERALDALKQGLGSPYWFNTFNATPTMPSGTYEAWRLTGCQELLDILKSFAAKLQEKPLLDAFVAPPEAGLEKTLYLKRPELNKRKLPPRHGVLTNEYLNSVFAAYRTTGNPQFLEAVRSWYAFFDKHLKQPFGAMVMDEEWGLPGPYRATETCAIAAELWTRLNLLAGLGESHWGDDIEREFFNAVPGCVAKDWYNHVYMQLPNRFEASYSDRFSVGNGLGPEAAKFTNKHYPLCCTAGLNRLLPEYIQAMWMTTAEGGVAATLYGPCTFETTLPSGRFAVTEDTQYPFSDIITMRINDAPSSPMSLCLRLPGWCQSPEIILSGQLVQPSSVNGFAVIRRLWQPGDTITIRLPMAARLDVTRDYDDTMEEYAYVSAGPLLFVKPFAEKSDNEPAEQPSAPVVNPEQVLLQAQLSRSPLPAPWEWSLDAPVTLTVKDDDGKPLELVPYGCSKLHAALLKVHRHQ